MLPVWYRDRAIANEIPKKKIKKKKYEIYTDKNHCVNPNFHLTKFFMKKNSV